MDGSVSPLFVRSLESHWPRLALCCVRIGGGGGRFREETLSQFTVLFCCTLAVFNVWLVDALDEIELNKRQVLARDLRTIPISITERLIKIRADCRYGEWRVYRTGAACSRRSVDSTCRLQATLRRVRESEKLRRRRWKVDFREGFLFQKRFFNRCSTTLCSIERVAFCGNWRKFDRTGLLHFVKTHSRSHSWRLNLDFPHRSLFIAFWFSQSGSRCAALLCIR